MLLDSLQQMVAQAAAKSPDWQGRDGKEHVLHCRYADGVESSAPIYSNSWVEMEQGSIRLLHDDEVDIRGYCEDVVVEDMSLTGFVTAWITTED